MPESPDTESVLTRRNSYLKIVEEMVLQGIEHPTCELKREATISKDKLADRFDFVKFVQGIANSHKTVECLIVIGDDEKQKKFFDVENVDEFDSAKLSKVLRKYLDPAPEFEVFNDVRVTTGERVALIVFNRIEPRPIIIRADGQVGTKTFLRPGEIWIKSKTELRSATKTDLDLMYEPAIVNEADKRARIVLEHLMQDMGPRGLAPAISPIPVPELLSGSREVLKRFMEARLATGEIRPFTMLLEMARATLVDKWSRLNEGHYNAYVMPDQEHQEYLATYAAEYLPVLQSVVDIGLVIIMYQGPKLWLESVVGLLAEAFEAAKQLKRLRAYWDAEVLRQSRPSMFEDRVDGVEIIPLGMGRPAYEIYLGARVLATYATMRRFPDFLGVLLSQFVLILSDDNRFGAMEPLVFFPFAGHLGLPQMMKGRNETYWEERIGLSWPEVFGSKDAFLTAAAGLELILEFSSEILVNLKTPELEQYKQSNPTKRFGYTPDFWKNPLDPAILQQSGSIRRC